MSGRQHFPGSFESDAKYASTEERTKAERLKGEAIVSNEGAVLGVRSKVRAGLAAFEDNEALQWVITGKSVCACVCVCINNF